jgi:hypothetical protein
MAIAEVNGDDVVAGGILDGFGFAHHSVVKLSGASVAELWRQQLDERSPFVSKVIGDGGGGAFVVGALNSAIGLRLSGLDGTVGPVAGRKLRVRDNANDPGARRIDARLKDVSIVTPAVGSSGDPTVGGATLELVNPITSESAQFSLPSGGWTALGVPPGKAAYRYKDPSGSAGPCKVVQIRARTLLKASCSGRLGVIPFTLDEPTQETLSISLRLGAAEPQCATFGAGPFPNVGRDAGTTNPGPTGIFDASRASPLDGTCP